MSIEVPQFATVKEAAQIARNSPWTIRAWLSKGLLPRHKARGKTLVRVDQLLAFIKPEDAATATARNVEKARKASAARKGARSSHPRTRAQKAKVSS